MNFYKFRVCSDEHLEKIFKDKQLYMSNYKLQQKINDEKEGCYFVDAKIDRKILDVVKDDKRKMMICSAAKGLDNQYMWENFAASGAGLCIEFNVIDSCKGDNVNYQNGRPRFTKDDFEKMTPEEIAWKIIHSKDVSYENEDEHRFIKIMPDGEDSALLDVKIEKVYFGWAMTKEDVEKWSGKIKEHLPNIDIVKYAKHTAL